MENNDLIKDDFLGKLIQGQPPESPSAAFVDEIMAKIHKAPVTVPAQRPFFLFLKNYWQYALLFFAVVIFIMTSDLPFSSDIPGKNYFSDSLLPYFHSLFSMIKSSFGSLKNISIPLMIVAACGLLLLMDHLLFRKPKMQNLMII